MTTATAGDSPAAEPTAHATVVPTGRKPGSRRRPRWATPVAIIGLLLAVSIAVTLLNPGGEGNTDDLDPANPGPSGAQGLAQVLSSHGVSVTVVRNQQELLDQSIEAETTVVVTSSNHLSGRTAKAALSHAATAAGLVLLDPDQEVTRGMGLPVHSQLTDLTDLRAACQDAPVGENFRLAHAQRSYTTTANPSDVRTCFPDLSDGAEPVVALPGARAGAVMVVPGARARAALVVLPGAPGRPPVTLLGDDSLITNGAILDADNAAIALHLLGPTSRLVWYIPSTTDIAATDGTSRSLAPTWFRPGLALTTSAVLLLCLWRGRRLGPLVTEPLPVVVRAVETTESRGRMYHKARDRHRAMAVLQLATRRRLAAYLGLSASSGVSAVAAAAAAVSGRSYRDVLDLLSSPATHDDSSLLERANTLTTLEKEVRRT